MPSTAENGGVECRVPPTKDRIHRSDRIKHLTYIRQADARNLMAFSD